MPLQLQMETHAFLIAVDNNFRIQANVFPGSAAIRLRDDAFNTNNHGLNGSAHFGPIAAYNLIDPEAWIVNYYFTVPFAR
jgi:hypothetical protein